MEKEKIEKEKAVEIATWMVETMENKKGMLDQGYAAGKIRSIFGKDFILVNQNGNWGIRKEILIEFNKLTSDTVVWSKSSRVWRKRKPSDPLGKRQVP